MKRPDIGDRLLLIIISVAVLAIAAWFLFLPQMPRAWRVPGSPPLYVVGLIGSALLLVSVLFLLAKRSGRGGSPVAWFVAHILASSLGAVLIAIHSVGYMRRPPALLLLAILGLVVLGVWARVRLSRRISATFASKHRNFGVPDREIRAELQRIIERKTDLLHRLDPAASEATFSPTLGDWLRRPGLTRAYHKLVREEQRVLGTRQAVSPTQAYWRAAHIGLAALFVIGLIIHVVTVTFFAGYVADGGEIYWWHLAAW